jgi:hypothetical protein
MKNTIIMWRTLDPSSKKDNGVGHYGRNLWEEFMGGIYGRNLYNYSVIEVNNDVFIIKISLMLCKNAIETVMQWFPNNLQISEK